MSNAEALGAWADQLGARVRDAYAQASVANLRAAALAVREDVIAQAVTDYGVEADYVLEVDGRAAELDDIQLTSKVWWRFNYLRAAAALALTLLRQRSPVLTGAYRDAHAILVDGVEVAALPARLSRRSIVTLINTRPYARKIEVANPRTGARLSIQAPDGVYPVVQAAIAGRFGSAVRVTFAWSTVGGVAGSRRLVRRRGKSGAKLRWPSLILEAPDRSTVG